MNDSPANGVLTRPPHWFWLAAPLSTIMPGMSSTPPYASRFPRLVDKTLYARLPEAQQTFVREQAMRYRFTHQELRQLCEIAVDLNLWAEAGIDRIWPADNRPDRTDKQTKKRLLDAIRDHWEKLRRMPNSYPVDIPPQRIGKAVTPVETTRGKLGLGYCPVASPRTRCCNLLTLDAVENCGYGCSYCSIQSFYDGKEIRFDRDFARKLAALEIDPDRIYHIGTGQSSDSLMWGNSHGVLDALLDFARAHPNVILEFKTKSANVGHLLRSQLPPNLLCTWSLNTDTIITHEEHGTASLEKRLAAARAIADKGGIVGFHFHPMVHYDHWEPDYREVIEKLTNLFEPSEVALVSLGTLTFIKPVMREIRQRGVKTRILKLPLENAEGKLSYPDDIKIALFSHAFRCFPRIWREQVFFYLCMEHQRFWKPVFGFEYESNDAFESAMKTAYLKKLGLTSSNT